MKRRDFFKLTSTGLAGAAISGSVLSAADFPQRASLTGGSDLQKAVMIGMVEEGETLREKFELLSELGFDGVELNSPNDHELEEVLDARDASGIEIHGVVNSVHWNSPFSHPDPGVLEEAHRGMDTALRDAEAYGADTVLLVPAVVNEEVSYEEAYHRSQEEIRKHVPLAEELDVVIAIENVWNHFLLSPLEFATYVDEFESPAVGAYFDIGNIVNYGWPEQWIRTLGSRIRKLHVKEFSRSKRNEEGLWEGFNVEIGEGSIDWEAVSVALRDIGYNGWATAEVGGGGAQRLQEVRSRMHNVLG